MNKQQNSSVDTCQESKNSRKKDRNPLLIADRYIFPIIMDIFIQEQYTSSDCYFINTASGLKMINNQK